MIISIITFVARFRALFNQPTKCREQFPFCIFAALPRRSVARVLLLVALVCIEFPPSCLRANEAILNLAPFATAKTSFVSGNETLDAIHNGFNPANSGDHSHDAYGNWPSTGVQWVEYDWDQPISTRTIEVYWWRDWQGIRLPTACRLLTWNGSAFVPVREATGLGVIPDKYNTTTFPETTTSKLRLEFTGDRNFSTGILQWKVEDSGKSPKFPPRVYAGHDASVVLSTNLQLTGNVKPATSSVVWSKTSGPGDVTFENPYALETIAHFSTLGSYTLKLTGRASGLTGSDTVQIKVVSPMSPQHLAPVYTTSYKINSPLWSDRVKQLIIHWVPHCMAMLSEPDLNEGGVQNLIEAGNKNAGKPHAFHVGPPWSDAYVFMTMEAMCWALTVDPQGDQEIIDAQASIRSKLDDWIAITLAAQEKDGYLQSRFTLGISGEGDHPPGHWTQRGDHEGYVAGAFIEAAIADYQMTQGRDRRLYAAALRLVDCWNANLGPAPKRAWFDGHENIEQALCRLGRFRDEFEGQGKGREEFELAKFLLDSRKGGGDYDQSRKPLVQQSEAVGHAVRAVYCYSAMTDVAMELNDLDYQSAVQSIWSDLVDKKYYVTGGVGSGESSEGFGADYSLPNTAYCESCSGCGELIFQHKMNMAYADASYADLYEETLYNAILGSVDLKAENFTYTNPLVGNGLRYPWHVCPCCVGNIPRILLNLPEWIYCRAPDGIDVNLYVGSTISVGPVAGTNVELVQETAYPWKGAVSLTVNPSAASIFTIRLRIPRHDISQLYKSVPEVAGYDRLAVNGEVITPKIKNGYVAITREWKAGDKIELELPLKVQRVRADDRVAADRRCVALRYGPLIYTVEGVAQETESFLTSDAPLTTEWNPNLLDGVIVIHGQFANGTALIATPYYARQNRLNNNFQVWIKDDIHSNKHVMPGA